MKFIVGSAAVLSALLFCLPVVRVAADSGKPEPWERYCDNKKGYIVEVTGKVKSGLVRSLRFVCNNNEVYNFDELLPAVPGAVDSPTKIEAANGFNIVSEWRDSQGNNGNLVCLSADAHGRVGDADSTIHHNYPNHCGKPGSKFCGFKVKHSATTIQQLEWQCCTPNGPEYPESSSSTGPNTGGEEQSSLPPPVLDSSTGGGGSALGDPQFIGFLGQSFQAHGMDNTVYNVISTPKLQFNALFTYLNKGECREGTLCFSHPGNYFGKVGVALKAASGQVHQVMIEAGPVKQGMKVKIDGEEVLPSQKHLTIDAEHQIYFLSAFECYVETAELTIKFENSDMFLNQQVSINTALMEQIAAYKAGSVSSVESMPHGILGQTWQRKEYNNRWKYIEGQLFDYIVADGLEGNKFKYNRFTL